MEESRHRKLDIQIKIWGAIITATTIIVGVIQFSSQQRNLQKSELRAFERQSSLEFERRLWEKQLSVYAEIADVAGKLATSTSNAEQFDLAVSKFYEKYWGGMVLVEDSTVSQSMMKFDREIQDYYKGRSSENDLKVRAYHLAKTCQESVVRYKDRLK
ncbi:hypothetical protein [Cyclobacterium marinum]|uniref:hypothetical protein n=1 Tax=Cyclobacterium marinum TaxID=104 RepID=UPI0011ED5F47|nr:hypothetical protein [Cyclobacterium marinum]MBI0401133.1 hypothetical protein [Cyclobacterium marinum]